MSTCQHEWFYSRCEDYIFKKCTACDDGAVVNIWDLLEGFTDEQIVDMCINEVKLKVPDEIQAQT